MTINIRDFAYPRYDLASRKRAASEECRLADDTHHGKRLRHSSSDQATLVDDAEARFEAAAIEGMLFQNETHQVEEYLASKIGIDLGSAQSLKSSNGAYDPCYPSHRRGTKVDEVASSILCDSPREALGYFKKHDERIRRRIKHVSFNAKALAFGASQNGLHWKGFCNYIRDHMCIEIVTIVVPHDPLSMVTATAAEDDANHHSQEITDDIQCLSDNSGVSKVCMQPPQLSQSERSALQDLRHTFDWKILSFLSQSLASGSIKEIRLIYPTNIPIHVLAQDLKAVQAIRYHSAKFAADRTRHRHQPCKAEQARTKAQYFFNLTTRRSDILGQNGHAIAVSKRHHNKQSHHRCSLLGLPRELRDRILELAVAEQCRSKSLHIMNYPIEMKAARARLKPLSNDHLSLRLVSRQMKAEVSRFLFKDKTVVLACHAGEAYRFLIQMPTDVLKHIHTLHFHELIFVAKSGENRKNWPRLSQLIGKQMAIQEVILYVPNEPSFPNAFKNDDDGEDSDNESSDSESNASVDSERQERLRALIKSWIGYWWPGAKLLIHLLMQGKISQRIKLRHEANDYLERCKIKNAAGLGKLKVIAELRYPFDCWLDEQWLRRATERFKALLEANGAVDEAALLLDQQVHHSFEGKELLDFDAGLGDNGDGHRDIIITRKVTQ